MFLQSSRQSLGVPGFPPAAGEEHDSSIRPRTEGTQVGGRPGHAASCFHEANTSSISSDFRQSILFRISVTMALRGESRATSGS